MKKSVAALGLVAFLLVSLAVLPGTLNPARRAQATHLGRVECPPESAPVHDGVLEPGEYSENLFDPKTKILVYFQCSEEANRTLHVAMVSPWEGWTEIRLQTIEAWTGDLNIVRTSWTGSAVKVVDGYSHGTDSSFVDDLALGGSYDVIEPAGKHIGDSYVYEIAVPLRSVDEYDSQLAAEGSFFFQLAYITLEAPGQGETSFMESDSYLIRLGASPIRGKWTSIDLSLPEGDGFEDASKILLSLRDEKFYPLPSRSVTVFARTSFGFLNLGTVTTNEQGIASIGHAPLVGGTYLIGASFPGGEGYLGSVAWERLSLAFQKPRPTMLPNDLAVLHMIIALVVGGVWATYAYSVAVVRHVLRSGAAAASRTGFRRGR